MAVVYLILSIILIILFTARYKIHPILVVIFYGVCLGMPSDEIITSVNEGFVNTLGGIGLLNLFGVIIGAFLEHSGGAYKIGENFTDDLPKACSFCKGNHRMVCFDSRFCRQWIHSFLTPE